MEVLPDNVHHIVLQIPYAEATSSCIPRIRFNDVVLQLRRRRHVWRRRPDGSSYKWYLLVWYLDSADTKALLRVSLWAGATKPVFGTKLWDNPRTWQVLPDTLTSWWHAKIVEWQTAWIAQSGTRERKPHEYFTEVFVTPT